MPVVHCGDSTTGCAGSKAQAEAAVAICVEAGGNCSISMDWSPFVEQAEHSAGRVDPRGNLTPIETSALALFKNFAVSATGFSIHYENLALVVQDSVWCPRQAVVLSCMMHVKTML